MFTRERSQNFLHRDKNFQLKLTRQDCELGLRDMINNEAATLPQNQAKAFSTRLQLTMYAAIILFFCRLNPIQMQLYYSRGLLIGVGLLFENTYIMVNLYPSSPDPPRSIIPQAYHLQFESTTQCIAFTVSSSYQFPFQIPNVIQVVKLLLGEIMVLLLLFQRVDILLQCFEDTHHLPFSCIIP